MSGDPQAVYEAMEELGRRASRLTTLVALPCVIAGISVGFPLYLLVRELQLAALGIHMPIVTGAIAWIVPGVAAVVGGRWLAARLVLSRRPSWIAELALHRRVDRREIEELFGG